MRTQNSLWIILAKMSGAVVLPAALFACGSDSSSPSVDAGAKDASSAAPDAKAGKDANDVSWADSGAGSDATRDSAADASKHDAASDANEQPSQDAARDGGAGAQDGAAQDSARDGALDGDGALDADATSADGASIDARNEDADGMDGALAGPCSLRTVSASTFCIEDVTAKAGQTVDARLYLLVPAGCTKITQSAVTVSIPSESTLETLDISAQDPDCRYVSPSTTETDYLVGQWSSSASSRCPESLPIGLFRTLKLSVGSSLAVGTYPLSLSIHHIGDNMTSDACRVQSGATAPAISGTLTVVP